MKMKPCKIDLSELSGSSREVISIRIRKACFAHGVKWSSEMDKPLFKGMPYLFIDSEGAGLLTYFGGIRDTSFFSSHKLPEVHHQDFLLMYEESPIRRAARKLRESVEGQVCSTPQDLSAAYYTGVSPIPDSTPLGLPFTIILGSIHSVPVTFNFTCTLDRTTYEMIKSDDRPLSEREQAYATRQTMLAVAKRLKSNPVKTIRGIYEHNFPMRLGMGFDK